MQHRLLATFDLTFGCLMADPAAERCRPSPVQSAKVVRKRRCGRQAEVSAGAPARAVPAKACRQLLGASMQCVRRGSHVPVWQQKCGKRQAVKNLYVARAVHTRRCVQRPDGTGMLPTRGIPCKSGQETRQRVRLRFLLRVQLISPPQTLPNAPSHQGKPKCQRGTFRRGHAR